MRGSRLLEEHIRTWTPGQPMMRPEIVFKDAQIEDVEPGETKSTTFVADKAGTYVYACFEEEPELHTKRGMWRSFIVEGSSGLTINPDGVISALSPVLAIVARQDL